MKVWIEGLLKVAKHVIIKGLSDEIFWSFTDMMDRPRLVFKFSDVPMNLYELNRLRLIRQVL
jgi:hypothetical protein